MVIFSFFSGVGMLDLGFQEAGFEIVFVNEYEELFMKAYQYARKKQKNNISFSSYYAGDINDFMKAPLKHKIEKQIQDLKEDGELIGFIGGPPCPDFSVAGKNRGRDGENGKLAKSYIDVINYYKPDFFLFENVKGLIRTERHRKYFDELKGNLQRNNYVLSEALLNALEFGVPQDRERVILIGVNCFSALSKRLIYVNNTFYFPWGMHKRYNIKNVKDMNWPTTQRYIQYSKRKFRYNVPIELTVEYWFRKNNVYKHANCKDKFKVRNGQDRIRNVEEGDVSRKSFKRLHRWRYSPTAAYGNNEVHLHPYRSRRLTVAEAMAIQSLPKWFELPSDLALTDKFKMIGNGVPYLMSYELAKTICEFFQI
ncbi:DNA cytosine methyltransferase [Ventrimonas sp. CLA-AP-H27]|uniref:DNA (cytosine-5-)-methyltransferase n=1 Tax=Ventrimonas faecis TaxID=3133170 RepID=A0ABV1HP61_9FIRM